MYHLLYIGSPQRKQIIAGVNSIVSGKMYKMLSFVFQQAVEQFHLKNTLSITMIIPFNTKFSTILIRTMMVYSRHQNTWMPRSWQWTTTVRFDLLLLYFILNYLPLCKSLCIMCYLFAGDHVVSRTDYDHYYTNVSIWLSSRGGGLL